MTDAPTAPAMPTLANAGELGPTAAPTAPSAPAAATKPAAAEHAPTYEQRRQAQDQAAAGDAPPPSADQQPPLAASTEKLKVGKYEVSEAELASMMDRQAQDDLKKLTLPASPDQYKAELPADLKLPGGVEYKFDQSNPSLVAARNWAHAKGLSQDEFSQVLGIYASHEAQQNAVLAERSRAEIAKAGVNAPQRVDAVTKWIIGEMGEADSMPIRATIVTDAHLRFYERIMQKISSQGTASFSQSHRAAPETNPIPGFDKMTFEQRREAQDRNAAARRR
jgi:hypothetical protein